MDNLADDFLRHGFELRSKLGSGTMGNVYLVFSKRYNLFFASKQILKHRHPQNNDDNIPLTQTKSKKVNFQYDPSSSNQYSLEKISSSEQLFLETPHEHKSQANLSASGDTGNMNLTRLSIEKILNSDGDVISEESKNEIKSLMMLDHPNVVKIYEVFEEGDYLYIILEYCENNSLKDFVNAKRGKRIYGNELFNFVLQMTLAVQYCHSMKIVHRDIKPANFLLDHYYRVKLADFGLSMTNVNSNSNNDAKACGSPAYMSPELLGCRKNNFLSKSSSNFFTIIDKEEPSFNSSIDLFKADIWALGINIYEIAVGRKPFSGTIDQIRKQVMHSFEKPNEIDDPSLIKLLRGMLQINPAARFNIEQILTSEYFVKHGYSDSQHMANSSRVQITLGKSPLTTSTPTNITPSLSNSQQPPLNRIRSRCTNSTSSFFIKRPTKATRNLNLMQTSTSPVSSINSFAIKSSRPQSIIAQPQKISPSLQVAKSNPINYQESTFNQYADAQKINVFESGINADINTIQFPMTNNQSTNSSAGIKLSNIDKFVDNDLSNSNSSMESENGNLNDPNAYNKPVSSLTMNDVLAGIGSGRLLTSNSISKGSKNTQVLKSTQPTFIHNK